MAPTNQANPLIEKTQPYCVSVKIQGDSPILFHRWNNEVVAEKAAAKKNSTVKKTDNLESYVCRDPETRHICVPAEYIRGAVITASKSYKDPRSKMRSMVELAKAIILLPDEMYPINGGVTEWEYEDVRRVQVQRAGISRVRPAFRKGWTCDFEVIVLQPEYLEPEVLHNMLIDAGRFCGLADFRPTFGRFRLTHFEVLAQD